MTRLADKPRPLRCAKQKLEPAAAGKQKEPEAAAEEKSEQKANTSFLLWGHRKAYVGLYKVIYIFSNISHYRPCAGAHFFGERKFTLSSS